MVKLGVCVACTERAASRVSVCLIDCVQKRYIALDTRRFPIFFSLDLSRIHGVLAETRNPLAVSKRARRLWALGVLGLVSTCLSMKTVAKQPRPRSGFIHLYEIFSLYTDNVFLGPLNYATSRPSNSAFLQLYVFRVQFVYCTKYINRFMYYLNQFKFLILKSMLNRTFKL